MMKLIVVGFLFVINFGFAQVNINTASVEELQTLSGIGEKKAKLVIKYRKTNGRFKNISELSEVKGIGEGILKKIKKDISITGKTDVTKVIKKKSKKKVKSNAVKTKKVNKKTKSSKKK